MSAAEVLAQHLPTQYFDPGTRPDALACDCGDLFSTFVEHAGHQLEVLSTGGYGVVDLSYLKIEAHIQHTFAKKARLGAEDITEPSDYHRGRCDALRHLCDRLTSAVAVKA